MKDGYRISGLKKFMKENNISVVDLDWQKLREHGVSMLELLKWEMKAMPIKRMNKPF